MLLRSNCPLLNKLKNALINITSFFFDKTRTIVKVLCELFDVLLCAIRMDESVKTTVCCSLLLCGSSLLSLKLCLVLNRDCLQTCNLYFHYATKLIFIYFLFLVIKYGSCVCCYT